MKFIKRCLVVLIALSSSISNAQQGATGRISAIYVEPSGAWARLNLDTATINPGNCPIPAGESGSSFYVIEFPSGTKPGPMLAGLYLAMAQRSTISMWISGCTTGAYWGATRPAARDLYLSAP